MFLLLNDDLLSAVFFLFVLFFFCDADRCHLSIAVTSEIVTFKGNMIVLLNRAFWAYLFS